MTSTTPTIRLADLRLERGGRVILRDVTLTAPHGSVTAVLGPSGSGKSTLLAALTGELVPAAGTVELFGQPSRAPPGRCASCARTSACCCRATAC